jgi:hypothetical protein
LLLLLLLLLRLLLVMVVLKLWLREEEKRGEQANENGWSIKYTGHEGEYLLSSPDS